MKIKYYLGLTAVLWMLAAPVASAQITVLPQAMTGDKPKTMEECRVLLNAFETSPTTASNNELGATQNGKASSSERDNLLGCAIKTGRISLAMVPYFITYFANYLLSIVAIVCVLFIVLGGYFYIYGGIVEKKDKGKAFITHALMGLGISTLAWIIVNSVMAIFTS
jgi:VIT1/CCC1 family predicted Fe2+/Mn2+ transporter